MKLLIWLLSTILLCSCVVDKTPTYQQISSNREYNKIVSSVVLAWSENSFLPNIPTSCEQNKLYYSFLDPVDFRNSSQLCATIISGPKFSCDENTNHCPNGCAIGFFRPHQTSQISLIALSTEMLNSEYPNEMIADVVRHEAIHWLSDCTGHSLIPSVTFQGMYFYPYQNCDANHLDDMIWRGETSVFERSKMFYETLE